MNLRKRITEEITEVKYDQFLVFVSRVLSSKYQNFSDDHEKIVSSIRKYARQFGFQWQEEELVNKAIASFQLSPTLNVNDENFIKEPKLKRFEVEAEVMWNGYGTDYYEGTLEGYSKEDIEKRILEDSEWNELELIERDVRSYEASDVEIQNMEEKEVTPLKESKNSKTTYEFSMYEDYYKNLSPDSFSIKRKGDEIIIKLKK